MAGDGALNNSLRQANAALEASFETCGSKHSAVQRQVQALEKLEKREKTDMGQWRIHLFSFVLILVSFTVQILRDTKGTESVIGISRCSASDNLLLSMFLSFSAFCIYYHVKRV